MAETKSDKLQIRNNTVDFLVFTRDAHEEGIEVRVQDHDVWLTQKAIGVWIAMPIAELIVAVVALIYIRNRT